MFHFSTAQTLPNLNGIITLISVHVLQITMVLFSTETVKKNVHICDITFGCLVSL